MTKQHTAYAVESLVSMNVENQTALANMKAYVPLVGLLSSESETTAESAVSALLCLADHNNTQKAVIKMLVDCLTGKSTSTQLKATEALAKLSCRNAAHRAEIVKAGAILPLVSLLGTGHRAEIKTPPERAAAILADLGRIAERDVVLRSENEHVTVLINLYSHIGELKVAQSLDWGPVHVEGGGVRAETQGQQC